MQGGNRQPKILMVEIPQLVKVRKYQVDIEKLKQCLKKHKTLSNKAIAEKLQKPITLVEHWFRKDSNFSIPSADVWLDLKKLLGITTTEFDKSIMIFETREGVYEKSKRCYCSEGLAPTLTAATANEKVLHKGIVRKLTPIECFKLMGVPTRVSFKTPVSPSQQYKQAGNSIVTTCLMAIFGELLGLDYETKINELVESLKESVSTPGMHHYATKEVQNETV